MATKKILIATGIYPPSIGGPATYSKILFEELPKHGIEAEVLSFDEVRHLPKIFRHLAYFFKIVLRSRGCDIIFAQDPVSVGLPAVLAAKIFGKRFFLKVVGDYAWEQGVQRYGVTELLDDFIKTPLRTYPLPVRVMRAVEYFVARHAMCVIVPSEYLKKVVLSWGVNIDNISVINNAFESSSVLREEEKPKTQFNGKTIVSASRLVPWKGFSVLVEVMAELNKKFPDLKLYIIGDGPEYEHIKRSIRELGLENHAYLVGRVSQSTLFDYIRQASVFVLNTGYEGFSHQLLEVLAIGTPLVTTNVGGNPEIVKDGQNGLLVEYNDKKGLSLAIERMLRDNDFALKCVTAGKEMAKQFTKDRMIEELIKIIK